MRERVSTATVSEQERREDKGDTFLLGKFFYDLRNYSRLTREEEVELIKKIREGDQEAREKFILSNIRLVATVAKRYISRVKHLKWSDLIQEGYFGLCKAVDTFDPEKGTFSNWGGEAIENTIKNAIRQQDSTMKGIHPRHRKKPISLDTPLDGARGSDRVVGDLVDDSNAIHADQQAHQAVLSDKISELLKTLVALGILPSKYKKVLEMRFGLEDGVPHTLEEIGAVFHVSKERIRQIEAKALGKIRQHHMIDKLKGY